MKQLPQLLHYCWTPSPKQLIKHGCAHHITIWTSLIESSKHSLSLNFPKGRKSWRNTVFPWLLLCSAWLKILSELCSATFCCSIIKWRSTPSICWIYIKLGLHAGRCLLCNLKNKGSWGSAAQSIQVDGPQECSSSHCQLPSNTDPTQLLSWSRTIMLQCQCNSNTVLEEQTQPKSPISCSCFRKLSLTPQNSD